MANGGQAMGGAAQPTRLDNVRHVIAVGAGKGGVGKSTAAALVALGLQRRGLRVGLMDADVYGPSVPTILGVAGGQPEVDAGQQRMLPVEAKGLKVISIGFLIEPDQAVIWRGPMVHGIVQQFLGQVAWGELDYMIVDLPPGTGDVPLTLAQSIPMTGAVIVCTPQDLALLDARRAIQMYAKLNVPTLGMIENMSYYLCPACGHRDEVFDCGGTEQAAAAMGVPFLGGLPLNTAIRRFCDAGEADRCFSDAGDAITTCLEQIVGNLVDRVEEADQIGQSTPTISFE